MLILGIDPGVASLGWAVIDSRDARVRRAGCVATERRHDVIGDLQRRLGELLDAIAPVMTSFAIALAVIEWSSVSGAGFQRQGDGSAHGNARAALMNAAAAAAMIGAAHARAIATLTPAPITWRSRLGEGTSRGSDELLHTRLARRYPKTAARFRAGQRPHVFDALGLALFGRVHAINHHHRGTEG